MKNKVVLITGASSGIGKALAFECASRGARLCLAARNIQQLESIAAELRNKGTEVMVKQTDISNETDCESLIRSAAEYYGQIDILVNNAGISMRALFSEVDLKVLHRLMDVNFWGSVYCTHYALPWLLQSKGSVAGVSSIAGYKGLPGRTGYSASKFALNGFLEVLRIENLRTGLHVLTCCPGFTASNIRKTALAADGSAQGESPRDENAMMPAEEVARRMATAIEKRKASLILTTQGKMTVMLNKFFPRMMDRMVFKHMAREKNAPVS